MATKPSFLGSAKLRTMQKRDDRMGEKEDAKKRRMPKGAAMPKPMAGKAMKGK